MNALLVTLMVIASGSALVMQNKLMMHARDITGSLSAALWLNSLVGLIALTFVTIIADGPRPFSYLLAQPSWWFVLPGLLGTFFVAAGLVGYSTLGAGMTIALLVASQFCSGLIFDMWRYGNISSVQIFGGILLVSGATLVAWR
ncbi:MAG: DMT family transporter [Sneathiella sp.]